MGQVLWVYLYLSQNIFYDATIILQFVDNFYKTTLHICSQETAFCCFYGRIAVPPCSNKLDNAYKSGHSMENWVLWHKVYSLF